MVNAMNKVLKDCIPDITTPFMDDILIKGCSDEEKEESRDKEGCRKLIADHMKDCEKVLQRLEDTIRIRATRDLGGRSLVWSIRPEALAIQSKRDPRHGRRMRKPNGG